MTPADELKRQIRRRIFARGAALQSRVSAFFATCLVCKGSGKEQQWVRYGDQDVCERSLCDRCAGAGFVEVTDADKGAAS